MPTLVESGYPDVSLDAWAGVVAPADTPPVTRLNALINEGLARPEVAAALAKLYALPKTGTPADLCAFLAAELPKWAQEVKLTARRLIEGDGRRL